MYICIYIQKIIPATAALAYVTPDHIQFIDKNNFRLTQRTLVLVTLGLKPAPRAQVILVLEH